MRKTIRYYAALFSSLFLATAGFAEADLSLLIKFPKNTSVEILKSQSGDFLGVGAIAIENQQLSQSIQPMKIEIAGRADKYGVWHIPEPIKYAREALTGIDSNNTSATVNIDLHANDGSVDKLQIVFQFVEETFYESPVVGIKYHFNWSSNSRYAHQVRETSWWTFGNSVDGSRWISQNGGYGRGSYDFEARSSVYFGGERPSDIINTTDTRNATLDTNTPNPVNFGYLTFKKSRETRQGDGEFVTFAGRNDISFIRYADTPTQNYWQFEHPGNDKAVRFEEWYCTPMGQKIRTAPIVVEIMHKSGVNAWIDAHEIVKAKLLAAAGLLRQEPLPWVGYTQYPIDDANEYRKQLPYDEALSLLEKAGIKYYWWYGPWRSNWSEKEHMTPEQIKKYGLYGHSVWDYDWAYNKFDIPKIRQFMVAAGDKGIEPVIWATQTMSQISPYVLAHPEWSLRNSDGSMFTYVYSDLVGMSHTSGYSDFIAHRIGERMKELPFSAVWLDSFFFAGDMINWMDPELAPNLPAAIGTMKKFYKAGIDRIYTEQNCPFALASTTGMLDPKKVVAGQQTYLLYDTCVCDHTDLSAEVYFKNLAFKSCPQPYIESYKRSDFFPLASYVNKSYVKAMPLMTKCVMLDDDAGTLWWNTDRSKAVIFTFRTGSIDIGRGITNAATVLEGTKCDFSGTRLNAEMFKVYVVEVR